MQMSSGELFPCEIFLFKKKKKKKEPLQQQLMPLIKPRLFLPLVSTCKHLRTSWKQPPDSTHLSPGDQAELHISR